MGQILKTKTLPHGKVIVYLELPLNEVLQLKNHAKKIHLFSENLCIHDTFIVEKGAKFGAKSVTVPLILKSKKKSKFSEVSYQKIDADSKTFYIATVKKDPLTN